MCVIEYISYAVFTGASIPAQRFIVSNSERPAALSWRKISVLYATYRSLILRICHALAFSGIHQSAFGSASFSSDAACTIATTSARSASIVSANVAGSKFSYFSLNVANPDQSSLRASFAKAEPMSAKYANHCAVVL